MNNLTIKISFLIFLTFSMLGCQPLISPYSSTAYEYATTLKVETLALMSKATDPYSNHEKEIEKLNIELNKAYEYAKGIPNNQISAKQWNILIMPASQDGKLIGKFWSKWEKQTKLNPIFIENFKKQVGKAFDEIICLEVNKEKATDCLNLKETN